MSLKIENDRKRFQEKLDKMKKEGIEKYFKSEKLSVPGKNGIIEVPIPNLDIPRFIHGNNGGVGSGEGDIGEYFPGMEEGEGDHENKKGSHKFGELNLEEGLRYLEEELKLPNFMEKFNGKNIEIEVNKYKGIRPVGPRSLRNFRKTYKRALFRSISSKDYDPEKPYVIIRKEDERFRSQITEKKPDSKAVIIYMMDYSYSMKPVIKFLQHLAWWADSWISKHYKKIERRYVHYESEAEEVDSNSFFTEGEGGGTEMREGFKKVNQILKDYPEDQFNTYIMQFTDGDYDGLIEKEEDDEEEDEVRDYLRQLGLLRKHETGNPFMDYTIKRINGLFVCEAQPYNYIKFYSDYLLSEMIQSPKLEKIIKLSVLEKEDLKNEGENIKNTLKAWFAE